LIVCIALIIGAWFLFQWGIHRAEKNYKDHQQ
jgi:hypothetical protein